MPAFIIYLIKANIALSLFFLAYRFGLRRLTFYTLNRYFLLFGIVFSILFPLINVDAFLGTNSNAEPGVFYYSPNWHALKGSLEPIQSLTAWGYVKLLFWIGAAIMTLRLTIQLFSLLSIHRKTLPGSVQGEKVRLLNDEINPFSFLKHIYINPGLHSSEEISNILSHEKVHVREWHTLDVLASEINQIFYWFNPGAWLMKAAIKENLEFIADHKVLISGRDPRAYQYSLIKLSAGSFPLAIANHFNISNLKIRIKMMNRKKSPGYMMLRYLLLVPVVLVTIFIVRTSEAQKNTEDSKSALLKTDTSRVIKNLPPAYNFNQKGYYIRIKTNTGETYVLQNTGVETGPYYLYGMDAEKLNAFNEKYGSYLTYKELQQHKDQSEYLKSKPEITKYSYSDENRILIWTGNTSKIYDISRDYDRNLLLKKYGSIPPRYSWLNTGDKPRVQFTPPRVTRDTTPTGMYDERATYEFHQNFLKRNKDIKNYSWKSGSDGEPAIAIIQLKNGKEEVYNMRNADEAAAAEKKYGTIPLPPPPPPPAQARKKNIPPPPPPTHPLEEV